MDPIISALAFCCWGGLSNVPTLPLTASSSSILLLPGQMESTSRKQVYLVTGGCGFLGKRLVQMLLEQEPDLAEVRVFDVSLDESLRALDRGEEQIDGSMSRLPLLCIQGLAGPILEATVA